MKLLLSASIFFTLLLYNSQINSYTLVQKTTVSDSKDHRKLKDYFIQKNWDSTLVYASKLLQKTNKKQTKDYCHYTRGYSFMKKGLFKEAKKEYNLVSKEFPEYFKIQKNLGGIHMELKQYKKAIDNFLQIKDALTDSITKSSILHDLGSSYFHIAKYKEAEKYLLQSSIIQEKKKDTLLLIGAYTDIANLYYLQYKDNLAIPYFKRAYSLSKKTKNYLLKSKTAKNMAVVEENRKDPTKALVYRKEYERWKDSVNDQNKIWSIAQVEKKLALTQKQKEIALLEFENKAKIKQRNLFILSSLLLSILFITLIYFYRQKSKTNAIILNQKEKLDTLNNTKDKLLSIISHDLRSSVNTIQTSFSRTLNQINKDKDAITILKTVHRGNAVANSTAQLLENLLHWASLQNQQLYFHIETINLFSVIQQVTYNYLPLFESKGLNFNQTIPQEVFISADIDSFKMILRNILDNAIKFSEETDSISINTYHNNNQFQHIVIEDTGCGMDDETVKQLLKKDAILSKKKNQKGLGTGLGIQLCKTMIEKNKGQFFIESEEGIGTKIIITLPKFEEHE